MDELTIVLKIGDWEKEYLAAEQDISSMDAIIERVREGLTPAILARLAIVAREREEAPEAILKPNKLLLHQGAAANLSGIIANRVRTVRLENGREINVREFVAPVPEEEQEEPAGAQLAMDVAPLDPAPPVDDGPEFAHFHSPKALARARAYLLRRVPGYIKGRLDIIAANSGDVRGAVNELQSKIEEMVAALV